MSLTLQPVRVANGFDEDRMLVFSDGRLMAVLVRLSDENEVAPGDWFLEAGFGRVDGVNTPPSQTWRRRGTGSRSASGPHPCRLGSPRTRPRQRPTRTRR